MSKLELEPLELEAIEAPAPKLELEPLELEPVSLAAPSPGLNMANVVGPAPVAQSPAPTAIRRTATVPSSTAVAMPELPPEPVSSATPADVLREIQPTAQDPSAPASQAIKNIRPGAVDPSEGFVPPPVPDSFGTEIKKGLKSGSAAGAKGLAKLPGALVDIYASATNSTNQILNKTLGTNYSTNWQADQRFYDNPVTRALDDIQERNAVVEGKFGGRDIFQIAKDDGSTGVASYIFHSAIATLPLTAAAIGMSAAGAPQAGVVTLFAGTGIGDSFGELRERLDAGKVKNYGAEQMGSLLKGLGEGLWELAGSVPIGKMLRESTAKIGVEATKKSFGATIKNVVKKALIGAAEEGPLEEGGNSLTNDLIDNISGIKTHTVQEMITNFVTASAIGATIGGPVGGLAGGLESVDGEAPAPAAIPATAPTAASAPAQSYPISTNAPAAKSGGLIKGSMREALTVLSLKHPEQWFDLPEETQAERYLALHEQTKEPATAAKMTDAMIRFNRWLGQNEEKYADRQAKANAQSQEKPAIAVTDAQAQAQPATSAPVSISESTLAARPVQAKETAPAPAAAPAPAQAPAAAPAPVSAQTSKSEVSGASVASQQSPSSATAAAAPTSLKLEPVSSKSASSEPVSVAKLNAATTVKPKTVTVNGKTIPAANIESTEEPVKPVAKPKKVFSGDLNAAIEEAVKRITPVDFTTDKSYTQRLNQIVREVSRARDVSEDDLAKGVWQSEKLAKPTPEQMASEASAKVEPAEAKAAGTKAAESKAAPTSEKTAPTSEKTVPLSLAPVTPYEPKSKGHMFVGEIELPGGQVATMYKTGMNEFRVLEHEGGYRTGPVVKEATLTFTRGDLTSKGNRPLENGKTVHRYTLKPEAAKLVANQESAKPEAQKTTQESKSTAQSESKSKTPLSAIAQMEAQNEAQPQVAERSASTAKSETNYVKSFARGIERASGVSETVERVAPSSDEHHRIDALVKGLTGKLAVFFKAKSKYAAAQDAANYNGRIFVNEDAKGAGISVTLHEAIHDLRTNHPDLHKQLMSALRATVATDYKAQFKALMDKKFGEGAYEEMEGRGIVHDEILGYFAGQVAKEVSFWNKVYLRAPTAVKKLADIIRTLLVKARSSKYSYDMSDVFADVEAMRDALADAVGEAMNRAEAEAIEEKKASSVIREITTDVYVGEVGITPDAALFSLATLESTNAAVKLYALRNKTLSEAELRKFFRDTESIAKIVIGNPMLYDYESIEGFSPLRENRDPAYKRSLDFTTMCKKRYVMQATVDAIQAKIGRPLESEEYMRIRKELRAKGVETSCGACYVDSRRINIATVLKKAMDAFPDVPKRVFLTMDGLTRTLPTKYPKAYKAVRGLFGGTQIKIPEPRTEYNSQILHIKKPMIAMMNRASGLRWQSWSDFEIPHILDAMQAVVDMAAIELKGQAYTKVPAFAEILGPTGMAINMSLIPKGNGFENGNLVFDEAQSFPVERAKELREQYDNVGTIAIGISDKHIKALLESDWIDYVIPYHMSGLSALYRDMIGMSEWQDYASEESFRDVDTNKKIDDIDRYVFINEYRGDKKLLDKLAKERGVLPPFARMQDWDGYEKLVTDRRIYDNNGDYYEQSAVRPNFDMVAAKRAMKAFEGVKADPDETTVKLLTKEFGAAAMFARTPAINEIEENPTFQLEPVKKAKTPAYEIPLFARANYSGKPLSKDKIQDPFAKIYAKSHSIDFSKEKISSEEDLLEYMNEKVKAINVELTAQIDPEPVYQHELARLALRQDPEGMQAYAMATGNKEQAIKMIEERISTERKRVLTAWANYIAKENDEYAKNPFIQMIIWEGITKEIAPDNEKNAPELSPGAVAQIVARMAETQQPVNFLKAYNKAAGEIAQQGTEKVSVDLKTKGSWVRIPSLANTEKTAEDNTPKKQEPLEWEERGGELFADDENKSYNIRRDDRVDSYRVYIDDIYMGNHATIELAKGHAEDVSKKEARKPRDPIGFTKNVQKLKELSSNSWCTKTYNAEPYLRQGDFWLYIPQGKETAEVAIRFVGDNIQEIQGVKNDRVIPMEYYEEIKYLIDTKGWKGADKQLEQAKQDFEKEKALRVALAERSPKKRFTDRDTLGRVFQARGAATPWVANASIGYRELFLVEDKSGKRLFTDGVMATYGDVLETTEWGKKIMANFEKKRLIGKKASLLEQTGQEKKRATFQFSIDKALLKSGGTSLVKSIDVYRAPLDKGASTNKYSIEVDGYELVGFNSATIASLRKNVPNFRIEIPNGSGVEGAYAAATLYSGDEAFGMLMPIRMNHFFEPRFFENLDWKTEPKEGGPMFARAPRADTFFSPTLRAVQALKQEKGTGEQFFNQIAKAPGVREAEWKWMGLDDFLKGKPSVTKAEVEGFVRENQVQVEEVKKGSGATPEPDLLMRLNRALAKENFLGFGTPNTAMKAIRDNADWIERWDIQTDELKNVGDEYRKSYLPPTKYGSYVLPGGVNYREVLLTLPQKPTSYAQKFAIEAFGKPYAELTKSEQSAVRIQVMNESKSYRSSHWSEPNVIAHFRLDDRTGPDGEKVLFIEEIQSDWAREARDKGINQKTNLEFRSVKGGVDAYLNGERMGFWPNTETAERDLRDHPNYHNAIEGVPNQPFLKNWEELTLKRVLRMAAEEGYDRVAWINGEQTADRYDLSKQIDEILFWGPDAGGDFAASEGEVGISIYDKKGNAIKEQEIVTHKELKDLVGKDVAKRIIEGDAPQAEGQNKGVKVLKGDGLKIGGKWAHNLYDVKVPQILGKIGKKFGAAVESVSLSVGHDKNLVNTYVLSDGTYAVDGPEGREEFDTEKEADDFVNSFTQNKGTQQSLPITEALAESVLQGQPMFAHAPRAELDAVYRDAVSLKKPGLLARLTNSDKSQRDSKTQFFTDLLVPISTRIEMISSDLKYRGIRKFSYDLGQSLTRDGKAVLPFLEKYEKMDHRDKVVLDFALKNEDSEKVKEILAKYGAESEYAGLRKVLNDIYERALEAGMDFRYIIEYFPRSITDSTGLLEVLRGTPEWGAIEGAIREEEDRQTRNLTELEKAKIADRILGSKERNIETPDSSKARTVSVIDTNLNRFYDHSPSALLSYIHDMNYAIELRNFLGGALNENPNALDVEKGIGAYVANLIDQGKITPEQQDELIGLFRARFNYKPMQGSVRQIKNVAYITAMGSGFSSFISQLGDLAWAFYDGGRYAPAEFIKAVVNKSRVSKIDLGVDRIAEEFRTGDGMSKVLEKIFKFTLLEKMDRVGKEALINASLRQAQRKAKNGDAKFVAQISKIFGKETGAVLDDLRAGRDSENVKYYLFNKLLDYQPIALEEMPKKYLDSPNGRIGYALKTFTIKQLDVFRREGIWKIKNAKTATERAIAIGNFMYLIGLFVAANGSADALKDLLFGRDPDFEDTVYDNIFRLFGLSRFLTWEARRNGISMAVAKLIAPPFDIVEAPYKDIKAAITKGKKTRTEDDDFRLRNAETWKIIPFFGKHYYWWFGGGRASENRRMGKKYKELRKEKRFDEARAYRAQHASRIDEAE